MANMQAKDGREAGSASYPIQLSSSNLGAFLEISPDAVVLINQAGLIVMVNQQVEALFGYTRAQLLDQPLEQLLPERFRDIYREHRARYFSTPLTRPMGAGLLLFGLRRDGTEFPLDLSLKLLLLDGRLVALVAVHDMSTQRHLEEELIRHRAAEDHLTTMNKVLSATPDHLYLLDPYGRYLFASESAAEHLGLAQADFLGKTWQELGFPADFIAPFTAQLQAVLSTGQTVVDEILFPVIAGERWFEYVLKPILDQQGAIESVIVASRDITERRRAADAVRQLASIVESSSEAIFSKTLEGVITSWNRSAETLFGYRAEEIIGQSVSLLIPPEDQPAVGDILAQTQLGQQPIKDYEATRIRKDGTTVAVSATVSPLPDHQGRIIGSSTIAHDIAEQKRMEGELARREDDRERIMHKLESLNQQLDGLFAHAPAGLVLFDARPPYQVLLHNTFFQEFFPEPFYSEGMLGKYLSDYVPRAEEDGVSEVFRQVVSTRQGVTLFNFVYDGMPRGRTWWNWHLAPIIKDGEVTGLTQMMIETTHEVLARQQLETELAERTRAEDALRQSRDELVATNAALEEANLVRSQFLATMSHELRTPLTSIIGYSELLLEDAQDGGWSQQQQNYLERILSNSEHLLGLINDVLNLSKMEAGRIVLDVRQVDARELLSDVATEIGSLAIKRNLFLKTEVEEGVGSLETNPGKLHQILLNLVSNALKFTEHGGVTLSASRVLLSDEKTEGIAIAVQDSGIGIPPDIQERVFEAFYQVDMSYTRRVGGTGLGLAIVSQLTALLGGTITIASAPGQGSTFTLTLPVKATRGFIGQGLPRLHPGQQGTPSRSLPLPQSSCQHHPLMCLTDLDSERLLRDHTS